MHQDRKKIIMDKLGLGKKIQEYRKRKDLTIKELAEKVEVTASLLSQIERGLADPSLNTLRMLSNALEIPMFNLFIEDVDKQDLIVRSESRKKVAVPSDNAEYALLSPDLSGTLEMVLMTVPAKKQSARELLAHTGEEVAFILKGPLTLYLEDSIEVLKDGDSVKIPPGLKHRWENKGNTDAKIIFAITPPSF